jgi:enhancing lycopene biosynthesis protein 2
MKTKKIAVLLGGCGRADGSEIHESTLTLLAIVRHGATYQCFAPDIPQYQVVDHLTGKAVDESRNVLVESARIARGDVKPLGQYNAADFDALVIPGGSGIAKNLFTYAIDGIDMKVNPEVEKAVLTTYKAGKPIGALCIAPVLIAKLLGQYRVELTLGSVTDKAALAAEKMGAVHRPTNHGEIIIDKKNKVVTTPCYMLNATIADVADGAHHLVEAVLKLVQ